MNVFEAEVGKYERRLARIMQNPSKTMLKSNRLLYQAHLVENQTLLKAWEQGKTFFGVAALNTQIMRCFGDFGLLPLVRIADRMGSKRAEEAMEKVRALGMPDYACDRTMLFLPLALMGNDLPRPRVIVAYTGSCEVVHDSHRTLARLLKVPFYSTDVPFRDPAAGHLQYVVKQLEGLIEWVEANVPGARFDEQKLVERQKYSRRWRSALHEIHRLRRKVPCPDHPQDVFREPPYPGQFFDPSLIVEYYESYRDELRERADRGWTPVGEEKLRIVWAITGPYGSDIWKYLAGQGVSIPFWQFGAAPRDFWMPIEGDETEFGKTLSPLEEEARTMLYNSWGGIGERWIRDTVSVCKDFKADGLVLFEQTGCFPVSGIGQILAKRVESEAGLPAWRVEGRQLLSGGERDNAQFMTGLEAFVDLCLQKKRDR